MIVAARRSVLSFGQRYYDKQLLRKWILSPNTSAAAATRSSAMSFHFATKDYESCFVNLPQPNSQIIRQDAIEYLQNFDVTMWHKEPVSTTCYDGVCAVRNRNVWMDSQMTSVMCRFQIFF
jgi:hypothetical protein